MRELISKSVEDAIRASTMLREEGPRNFIEQLANLLWDCFNESGKVMIAGNGGSLCDAMHFAEELTGFFRKKRRPLPAIAFSDPGHMSCVANDVGFSQVYSRLVESLGQKQDVFIAMTTSGNSENLILAAQAARRKGIKVVGFLGKGGGVLKGLCDYYWSVDGFSHSDRIQEAHMIVVHVLIELLEEKVSFESFEEAQSLSF